MDTQNRAMIVRLQPEHARAYAAARQRMLEVDPWAFSANPLVDVPAEVARVEELLADTQRAIVGAFDEDSGAIVATAGVIRPDREKLAHWASIWGVWTDPAHRGRGLARGVMLAAIDVASSMPGVGGVVGVVGVQLSVTERSPAARALYESLGFRVWGTQPDAMRIGGESAAEHFMQVEFENVRRG